MKPFPKHKNKQTKRGVFNTVNLGWNLLFRKESTNFRVKKGERYLFIFIEHRMSDELWCCKITRTVHWVSEVKKQRMFKVGIHTQRVNQTPLLASKGVSS